MTNNDPPKHYTEHYRSGNTNPTKNPLISSNDFSNMGHAPPKVGPV